MISYTNLNQLVHLPCNDQLRHKCDFTLKTVLNSMILGYHDEYVQQLKVKQSLTFRIQIIYKMTQTVPLSAH